MILFRNFLYQLTMINLRRRNYGAHKLGYHISLSFFFISIRKKLNS